MEDFTDMYKNVYGNSNSGMIHGFKNLIWVWKGSIVKMLWKKMLAFLITYFSLSMLYWNVLLNDEANAQYFEMICIFCERYFILFFKETTTNKMATK